jgi:hypothetical protein
MRSLLLTGLLCLTPAWPLVGAGAPGGLTVVEHGVPDELVAGTRTRVSVVLAKLLG